MPAADVDLLDRITAKAVAYKAARGGAEALRAYHDVIEQVRRYVVELVDALRATPEASPFLATLIEALDGGAISERELVAMFFEVSRAGTESTMSAIVSGIYSLIRHDDQWRLLRENPGLAGRAVEECLRFESPVQAAGRNAAKGARVHGTPVRSGCRIVIMVGSANRDALTFHRPDEFDIERADVARKLVFGLGSHQCLGQGLARTEASVAFSVLAERYPDAELAGPGVKWRRDPQLRCPTELRVALGARGGAGAR
jgi:cytochrome P450